MSVKARRFLVVAGVVVGLLLAPMASAATRAIPPASGCLPSAGSDATPFTGGLDPVQLAAAYGISSLWSAGYQGQGQGVALIEIGQSLGTGPNDYTRLTHCYDAPREVPSPIADVVPITTATQPPKPGGEGVLDPEIVSAIAPRAQIYLFESGAGTTLATALAGLLNAALNPANTGGKEVDTISISDALCEAAWTPALLAPVQEQLRRAASLGVSVLAAEGDAGSADAYSVGGAPRCLEGPVSYAAAKKSARTLGERPTFGLGLNYPASSPFVTSVGGTEFHIAGTLPYGADPAGGTIISEDVWDQPDTNPTYKGFSWAGGGGDSKLFTVADAPWERDIGISGHEEKPDISALAGSPGYLQGATGTTGASPLMAGAIADLDGYLEAHGAPPAGPLNPTLYNIAADRALYRSVFNDITTGTNDTFALGCCKAGASYDKASGLGSLDIAGLGAALLAQPSLRVPWSTVTLTAHPGGSIGVPEDVAAITNNVIRGTPYYVNLWVDDVFLAKCKTSDCTASFSPSPVPQTVEISADVGLARTKPFTTNAIVSKQTQVTVRYLQHSSDARLPVARRQP